MPVAAPSGRSTWTLMACAVGDSRRDSPARANLPPPPGGRRTLSIGTEHGGSIVGFSGAGEPLAWTEFYDRWFQQQAWSPSAAWQRGVQVWRRRFVKGSATADVLIQAEADGSVQVIVMIVEPGEN